MCIDACKVYLHGGSISLRVRSIYKPLGSMVFDYFTGYAVHYRNVLGVLG